MGSEPKKILLTGAGRGLGLAMAEGFIERGHTIWGCSRSESSVARLRERWSSPHDFQAVDVADDAQVAAWAKRLLDSYGPPDFVINNAATINRNAPLWEVPADEFDQVIDVNVKGVANVLRHFLPAMIERGSGVIVNFSSGWGRSTSPEVAPYCASKYAVEGLTKALADELPSGMIAVPLNPGIIHTDMLQSCFGEAAGDYPTPEQWAKQAVPYILGLSRKEHGQSVTVPAY